MTKKILKLVDSRACQGRAKSEMRSILRGIDSGEIVSIATVFIRRNGTLRTFFECECPIKALGSVELLKDYIRNKKFEQV